MLYDLYYLHRPQEFRIVRGRAFHYQARCTNFTLVSGQLQATIEQKSEYMPGDRVCNVKFLVLKRRAEGQSMSVKIARDHKTHQCGNDDANSELLAGFSPARPGVDAAHASVACCCKLQDLSTDRVKTSL